MSVLLQPGTNPTPGNEIYWIAGILVLGIIGLFTFTAWLVKDDRSKSDARDIARAKEATDREARMTEAGKESAARTTELSSAVVKAGAVAESAVDATVELATDVRVALDKVTSAVEGLTLAVHGQQSLMSEIRRALDVIAYKEGRSPPSVSAGHKEGS